MENIFKEISGIYFRLFDQKVFLNSEIKFFFKEFEEIRGDHEVDNLLAAAQITTDLKSGATITNIKNKITALSEINLQLDSTAAQCSKILSEEKDPILETLLDKNRAVREKSWSVFDDDMNHKRNRIDVTFEEKEEELVDFYSDLERKLHIN